MARRKFHGHRRGHAGRKWISFAGKVVGGLVIGGPAISAVTTSMSEGQSGLQQLPRNVLYNYTGYDSNNGNFSASQLGVGAASIVGGLVLMKVFSYVARRF